ncbi:hypothetical protein [Nonomuraea sp. NPDC003804]|uniref:hypothetical protein n=1 Tax=Nonomuraea sp. NPDC003804 TaxID=3154547 RepID=UPI0033A691E7
MTARRSGCVAEERRRRARQAAVRHGGEQYTASRRMPTPGANQTPQTGQRRPTRSCRCVLMVAIISAANTFCQYRRCRRALARQAGPH